VPKAESSRRQRRPCVYWQKRRRRKVWTAEETRILNAMFPIDPADRIAATFPERNWSAIEAKARDMGLHRPPPNPLGRTLSNEGDVGYSAGMVIADGSILETIVGSGRKRGRREGATPRPMRYYSIPQVKVSMEDKESIERLGKLWGRKAVFCQKSSTGNDVWSVAIGGKKALELMELMMPYLEGPKKRKAVYLLSKYHELTSLPVENRNDFRPFEGLS